MLGADDTADVEGFCDPISTSLVEDVELLAPPVSQADAAEAGERGEAAPARVHEGLSLGKDKLFVLDEILLDKYIDYVRFGQWMFLFR